MGVIRIGNVSLSRTKDGGCANRSPPRPGAETKVDRNGPFNEELLPSAIRDGVCGTRDNRINKRLNQMINHRR